MNANTNTNEIAKASRKRYFLAWNYVFNLFNPNRAWCLNTEGLNDCYTFASKEDAERFVAMRADGDIVEVSTSQMKFLKKKAA